jgi:hypothetical protein
MCRECERLMKRVSDAVRSRSDAALALSSAIIRRNYNDDQIQALRQRVDETARISDAAWAAYREHRATHGEI